MRHAAAGAVAALKRTLADHHIDHGIRWIPEENLHLTVWFLGEVSDQRAAAVLETLRAPLATAAFALHLAGFGAFPPSGPPRVLWMGVREGVEALSAAHDELGARLAPWGFPPEGRAYSAHLTLARVKDPSTRFARSGQVGAPRASAAVIREALKQTPADAGRCLVESLTVFRSRTAPAGAVYEPLLRVPLS